MKKSDRERTEPAGSPVPYLFSKTWKYSDGNRGRIVQFIALFIGAQSWAQLAQPLLLASIMNRVQTESVTEANIWSLLSMLLLIPLVEVAFWAMHGPARVIECNNAFRAKGSYRKHLLSGVMGLPLEWHAEHHSGDTVDRMEKGAGALYASSSKMFSVISAIMKLMVSWVMLAYFSLASAAIAAVMLTFACWVSLRFDVILAFLQRKLNASENQIAETVLDAISNIVTVIILRVELPVFAAAADMIDRPIPTYRHKTRVTELKWCIVSVCCSAMTALAMGAYFYQGIGASQGILAGSVFLLYTYLSNITKLCADFAYLYGDIMIWQTKMQNSEELSTHFRPESTKRHVLPTQWRELCISDLAFSYKDSETPQLQIDRLVIGHSERIALIGSSGGGKTTFLKTLRDLMRPDQLRLTVDGYPIPEGFAGISQAIALAPQCPEIFARSIKDNLTLGASYPDSAIRECVRLACADGIVSKLPRGWDTFAYERGVNLSGGEQQRIALARALLASMDKSLILLDEPTSNVDAANGRRIFENIFRRFPDKTILCSLHNLDLLPLFSRIIVFDGGRVVGSGTREQLLASCAEFRSLCGEHGQAA